MNIRNHPMMSINDHDICYIRRAKDNIENMFCAINNSTYSDKGQMYCADNGEIIITASEAAKVYDILNRVLEIYESAPKRERNPRYRDLAIGFEG